MAVASTALQQILGSPLGKQEIYETKKGDLGFRSLSFFNKKIDGPQAVRISAMFAGFIKSAAQIASPGVATTTILANVKQIKKDLLSKTTDPQEQSLIRASLKTAKTAVQNIGTPAQSKKKSGSEFITRRIARFVLYKLAQGGSFSALAAGLSLPASLAKDGVVGTASAVLGSEGVLAKGATKVFGPGGAAHTAATAAGKGLGATAGVIGSMVSSTFMTELLGFLVITEGPGVVGHLARRLTPKPVKTVYNFVTPNIVQRGVNFVTHTDKPVAKGLDYVIDGLAVAFR